MAEIWKNKSSFNVHARGELNNELIFSGLPLHCVFSDTANVFCLFAFLFCPLLTTVCLFTHRKGMLTASEHDNHYILMVKDSKISFVQRVGSTVHWMNYHQLHNTINFDGTYLLDGDLSSGKCYPPWGLVRIVSQQISIIHF